MVKYALSLLALSSVTKTITIHETIAEQRNHNQSQPVKGEAEKEEERSRERSGEGRRRTKRRDEWGGQKKRIKEKIEGGRG